MELTKEHFEKSLTATEHRVIKRIDDAQEELARIIADTVATPFTERLDRLEQMIEVKDDVQRLKREMLEIRTALHLGT